MKVMDFFNFKACLEMLPGKFLRGDDNIAAYLPLPIYSNLTFRTLHWHKTLTSSLTPRYQFLGNW